MPKPWHPPPFVQTSAALHIAAGLGCLALPQHWPLALGLLVADHGVLCTAGLLPRSRLLGPNLTRLPAAAAARGEIALTFDDGPDPEVTPRVLDLLDAAGVKATFFCIAARAQRHPQLARAIVSRGHAVENHTHRHPHLFSMFGPRRMAREIETAQHCLEDLCGRRPQFFRAVAGLRNVFLDPVLAHLDLTLASWSHRAYDTVSAHPAKALRRLARERRAGDILLLHDGHAASAPSGRPLIIEVLPVLLDQLREAGLKPVTLAGAASPSNRTQAPEP